jgi:membrane-bound lytic murein transglycosylase D
MRSKYIVFALSVGLLVGLNSTYSVELKAENQTPDSIVASQSNSSIWEHLRANFKLKHYHSNANVKKTAKMFSNKNYQLTTILERGAPYLHFIAQELEKRNLPAELVFLPLVESNYNPTAVSPKSASGLWQLMPATAKILGLEHNRGYSGSNDIYASTRAALDHLTHLNKKFKGDWLITLAAYNAGEGTLSRVIERNRAAGKPTDYWSLNIPYAETRSYVHRFLALVDIVENPDAYNIELPQIPNRPVLVNIQLQEKTDLNYVAKTTGVSLNEIYKYNPGIKRNVATTTPNGSYHLLLPAKKVQAQKIAMLQKVSVKEVTNELESADDNLENLINYRVKAGDSLKTIAIANDTSIQQLLAWNDQIKDPDLLAPGQLLNLYS